MVWSPKDLKMSMYFTKRLHGVVNVDVRMGICEVKDVMGKKEGWKCFDQGDGRNEGGTCKGYSCEKRKRPQHPVVVKSTVSRCYARAWRRAGPRGSWTKEKRRRNRTWNGSFAREEEE